MLPFALIWYLIIYFFLLQIQVFDSVLITLPLLCFSLRLCQWAFPEWCHSPCLWLEKFSSGAATEKFRWHWYISVWWTYLLKLSASLTVEKMTIFSVESIIEEFETLTKDASRVQRETLQKILEQNGETEYLKQFGLAGRTDPETFKACVPLVTHQDLEPYIQRIFDGDTSPILTRKPLTALTLRY